MSNPKIVYEKEKPSNDPYVDLEPQNSFDELSTNGVRRTIRRIRFIVEGNRNVIRCMMDDQHVAIELSDDILENLLAGIAKLKDWRFIPDELDKSLETVASAGAFLSSINSTPFLERLLDAQRKIIAGSARSHQRKLRSPTNAW